MQITLIRDYKPEATLGRVLIDGKEVCKMLERPNRNNQKDDPTTKENESSCIPEGSYVCKKYSSPKYPDTWQVTSVSKRDSILIHSANTVDQLLGCLAPCTTIIDMDPKKEGKIPSYKKYYGSQSKDAFVKLKQLLPNTFTLIITSDKTLCNIS